MCGKEDLVYFGNLRHKSDAVMHQGDNLTGAGDGDDEQIFVDLKAIPESVDKILIRFATGASGKNKEFVIL